MERLPLEYHLTTALNQVLFAKPTVAPTTSITTIKRTLEDRLAKVLLVLLQHERRQKNRALRKPREKAYLPRILEALDEHEPLSILELIQKIAPTKHYSVRVAIHEEVVSGVLFMVRGRVGNGRRQLYVARTIEPLEDVVEIEFAGYSAAKNLIGRHPDVSTPRSAVFHGHPKLLREACRLVGTQQPWDWWRWWMSAGTRRHAYFPIDSLSDPDAPESFDSGWRIQVDYDVD